MLQVGVNPGYHKDLRARDNGCCQPASKRNQRSS